ncbi:MAG: DUF6531 domain-containing protein, partial [Pseudomonadota bacterium]
MKGRLRAISAMLCTLAFPTLAQDGWRDFYAEPGLNPEQLSTGQDVTESIDLFSGNIQLSYRDLVVPGNGGLDITITRFYNVPQSLPAPGNPFGYGWTMHFGRITMGQNHVAQLCSEADNPDADTANNPQLEFADGGRSTLVRSAVLDDGTYITKDNWKADCIDANDYTKGLVATAPNGTRYYMRDYSIMQGETGAQGELAPISVSWLVDHIEDVHGNTISIAYTQIATGLRLPERIDTSDGRRVDFSYVDEFDIPITPSSQNARLSLIESNGQQWQYVYSPLVELAPQWGVVQQYALDQVIRPDGTSWRYDYGTTPNSAEYQRLTQATYPFGGQVQYSYQWLRPYAPRPDLKFAAIDTKTQTNPGQPTGTWRYEFSPGGATYGEIGVSTGPEDAGRQADYTRVITPT